jgi:CBS domain-containing protein
MSANVITITPDTVVGDIVATLLEHHISALPVIEQGRIVGMVGAGELLHRHESGTEGEPARTWCERLIGSEPGSAIYVRSHGVRADDIKSQQVTEVAANASLEQVASFFEAREVRRLLVMEGEQLVGIVTRADLVKALGATTAISRAARTQSDEAIRLRLQTEPEKQSERVPSGHEPSRESVDRRARFLGNVQPLPVTGPGARDVAAGMSARQG